jgi:hypothetical protein
MDAKLQERIKATAAEKQRRHRDRARAGRACLTIETDLADLARPLESPARAERQRRQTIPARITYGHVGASIRTGSKPRRGSGWPPTKGTVAIPCLKCHPVPRPHETDCSALITTSRVWNALKRTVE